jgi:hypothetical protein
MEQRCTTAIWVRKTTRRMHPVLCSDHIHGCLIPCPADPSAFKDFFLKFTDRTRTGVADSMALQEMI